MGEYQLDYKFEWRAHSQHFSTHLDGSSSFVTSMERYFLSSLCQGTSDSPVSEWTKNAKAAKQHSAPSREGLGWYNWLVTAVTGDADSWLSPEKLHDVSALPSGCFWSQKKKFICIICLVNARSSLQPRNREWLHHMDLEKLRDVLANETVETLAKTNRIKR